MSRTERRRGCGWARCADAVFPERAMTVRAVGQEGFGNKQWRAITEVLRQGAIRGACNASAATSIRKAPASGDLDEPTPVFADSAVHINREPNGGTVERVNARCLTLSGSSR